MKKFFVTLSAIALMAPAFAQEAEETVSFHQVLKTYFIDGGPGFMAMVALALVLGVAFVVERIIYLNLAEVNTKKLADYLELSYDQYEVVDAVINEFSSDMMFAALEHNKAITKNALDKNTKYMSYILNREQYGKYLKVLNATINNRKIDY